MVAETNTLGHEDIAASTAGWPKDGEDAIEKHNEILGHGQEKVASITSKARSRVRGGGLCPPQPERGRVWEPFESSHVGPA
jgi:hypothetical protein